MDTAAGSPTLLDAAIGLLFAAMLGAWVYSDAQTRRAPRPLWWGVGTFLFAIVALPMWLWKRPPLPGSRASGPRRCPWCHDPIQPTAVSCMHCGRDVPPDP